MKQSWRREGQKVPKKPPRCGRLRLDDGSCARLRPERKEHVWAYNVVHARTHDERAVRMLVIIDDYAQECLAIDAARRPTSDSVLARLAWLMATRGLSDHVRSDTSPEFASRAAGYWPKKMGVKTVFAKPNA